MNEDKIIKVYPMLTNDLKASNLCEYELGIILACVDEYKNSYKQILIHEASEKGTRIEFLPLVNEKDREEAKNYIVNLIENFKNKYDNWDLSDLLK